MWEKLGKIGKEEKEELKLFFKWLLLCFVFLDIALGGEVVEYVEFFIIKDI